jgi:hypothetical protein
VSLTLHLLAGGADIHLRLPDTAHAAEILDVCAEAIRGRRVVDFPDTLAPGAVRRSTVVINFEHVSGVWVDTEP